MLAATAKPVAASAIQKHVYKVFPNDLNAHQTVFGGMIMANYIAGYDKTKKAR